MMKNETMQSGADVTRLARNNDSTEFPMMSYSAVTSNRNMATAFINELLRVGQKILPDKKLTTEDVMGICNIAMAKTENGITMVEGRHLRVRITDQLSRAKRYKEPFSLMVLRFEELADQTAYESIVDTLHESLRSTDLMFLFKSRIVLLLPHTARNARIILRNRIRVLMETCVSDVSKVVDFKELTFPGNLENSTQVLDWTEDQLRAEVF